MLNAFKNHIEIKFSELLKLPFILACSGGIDSMVLTHLCAQCGLDFALAHCNFKLRGADSTADEKFIVDTANRLNKKVFVTHFDTKGYSDKNKVSVQMAARELRYTWFTEIMQKNDIQIIVTAHHADDNLETFLINLSRGTGIAGLIGIPQKTESIIRPLLPFSRERIASYAKDENIEWREDSSNSDTKYVRNNIRHQIVPFLKMLNPNFLENFWETQTYLLQTAVMAKNHIEELRSSIFGDEGSEYDGNVVKIPIAALVDLKPLQGYLHGLFHSYGFTEWKNVESLLSAMSGKELRSKTHRLVKDREFLLLAKIQSDAKQNFPILQSQTYQIGENLTNIDNPLTLHITIADGIEETAPHILYAAKKALKYPLTLRKWKEGDYFYPLGMRGKKKLSKFFKDEKINVIAKDDQWLLCSDNDIVWVVGRRADERFKVLDSTNEIVKFELKL